MVPIQKREERSHDQDRKDHDEVNEYRLNFGGEVDKRYCREAFRECAVSEKTFSLDCDVIASRARWILRKMSSPFALQTYRLG